MKKLAATLCLTALATAAFAQGTVNTANTAGTLFRTNSTALPGGTSGNAANGAPSAGGIGGGFQYAVLTAPSTVTTVDASLQGLLSAPWSDTGLRMTNGTLASGGRINGPSGSSGAANSWAPSTFQSFIVVGWSAGEGSTWAQVAGRLAGATFSNGAWSGGGLVDFGFLGASTIQVGAPGAPDGTGAFSLFGAGGGPQGTPIITPTTMFVVAPIPEPASMALIGLGVGALVIFRRRK
jgi:hypothetical protein